MITQKGDFKQGVINILLFSSMLNPAEIYLSKEIKSKTQSKSKLNSLKDTISKTIDNKMGLFRKKAAVEESIDKEIEIALEDTRNPAQKNVIDEILTKEENTGFLSKIMNYNMQEKKAKDEVKSALKNLYNIFISYAKSTYTAMHSVSKKIIQGPVKITLLKFIRVFEYILASLNPQWNKVAGSIEDLDTLAPAVSNHISINRDDFQYESGYGALRYRAE